MKKLLAVAVAVAFPVVGFVGFMAGAMWSGGLTVEAEGDGHGGTVPISGDVNTDGRLDVSDGIYILNYVFRGGPLPVPIECAPVGLPATGQTKCYDTADTEIACGSTNLPGQDGFYRAGCGGKARFVNNLDGTETDTCTKLMWQKNTADINGDGVVNADWDGGDLVAWRSALEYCESLNFAGHGDWRLPNVLELQSIVDYGLRNPSIDPSKFGAVSNGYWSSSTNAYNSSGAWFVSFHNGLVSPSSKTDIYYVRAVRGGL